MKHFFQGFINKCPNLLPYDPSEAIFVRKNGVKKIRRKTLDHLFLSTEYTYELCFVIRCLQNMTSKHKISQFFEWSVLTDKDVHPKNKLFKLVYLNDSERTLFESNRLYNYIKHIVWLQPSDIELIRRIYECIFYASKSNDPSVTQFINKNTFEIGVTYNSDIDLYNEYANQFKKLCYDFLKRLKLPKEVSFDGGSFIYFNPKYKDITLLLKLHNRKVCEYGEYTTDIMITPKNNNIPKNIVYKFISPELQDFIHNEMNSESYNNLVEDFIKNRTELQRKYMTILKKLIKLLATSSLLGDCVIKLWNNNVDQFITFDNTERSYNARGHIMIDDKLVATELRYFAQEPVNQSSLQDIRHNEDFKNYGLNYVKHQRLMYLSFEYIKSLVLSRLVEFNTIAPINESLSITFKNIILEQKINCPKYLTSLDQWQIKSSYNIIFANNIYKYLNQIKLNLGKLNKYPNKKYNQITKYFLKEDVYNLKYSNNHPDEMLHELEREFLIFEINIGDKNIIMDTDYYSFIDNVKYKDVKYKTRNSKMNSDEINQFIIENKANFKMNKL